MPGYMMKPKKKSKVMGKRKKLDMDKDGKLTKKDFAMLRNKKKGRALKLESNHFSAPFLVNGGGFPISHHLTIKQTQEQLC